MPKILAIFNFAPYGAVYKDVRRHVRGQEEGVLKMLTSELFVQKLRIF